MFHRPSFSRVSFSLASFHGVSSKPEQLKGRSGYWRLFFHRLQEQALEKKAEPKQPESRYEPVVELKDGSAIVGTPKPKKKVVTPEPVVEQAPTRKPKLTSIKPVVEAPNYIAETMRVQMEISRLFTAWQIPAIIYPAQDTEDEELLLLLAA